MPAQPPPALPTYDFDRPEMVHFVPSDARTVLDVGCSTGRFGALLRARAKDVVVVGVEPHPAVADTARARVDRVVTGRFPQVADEVARPGGYDTIVFNDVLEHMLDPVPALDAARTLLSPRGVIVASIPNVRHITALGPLLVRGTWTYTDTGVLDRTHVRFFTRSSTVALFHDAGWEILTIKGINLCRRPGDGSETRLRRLSRISRGRSDPFFFLQYAVVARPARGTSR